MQKKRLIVEGARVMDPSRDLDAEGHLVADDGEIVACGAGPVPTELGASDGPDILRLDARGLILSPGFWDLHVHFREPGQEDKETVATGSAAAAAGGFTHVVTMPNTDPVVDSAGTVALVRQRGVEAGLCRLMPSAAITVGLRSDALCEYDDLISAGAVAFTDDGRPVEDGALMRRALEYTRMLGVPVITHAEDLALSRGGSMNEGVWSTRLGIQGIPRAAEVVAVARDIELARLTGGRLHVAHVSCRESVELIRRAKDAGLAVTGETAPHFLDLTDADCAAYDARFKMNPPLREMEDQLVLIDALADGTLDVIATDHAPHTVAEKDRPFGEAPFGVIGLETSFAVSHDRLVHRGGMKLMRLIELMSTAGARIMGLPGGTLRPGVRADFTLIDTREHWTVREADLRSKGRNCPWLGHSLTGRVVATYLDGHPTYARTKLARATAQA